MAGKCLCGVVPFGSREAQTVCNVCHLLMWEAQLLHIPIIACNFPTFPALFEIILPFDGFFFVLVVLLGKVLIRKDMVDCYTVHLGLCNIQEHGNN